MEVTINYNGQALSMEVTVEVYEYLDRADHKEENLALADYDVGLRCWPELLESGTVDAEVVKEELYMWVAYSKMQVHRDLGAEN